MQNFWPIFKREIKVYFNSPVAYVFIIIFLMATAGCTFFLGNFYERQQADLMAFFFWHPWLYLFLVPAIGMRLWSEERKSGTIELLFTLPITLWEAVLAKFTASWAFIGLALLLTFPIVVTVNYLGEPDNGVIFVSYIGSFLMAGAFLAITCLTSALTKNQVISFVLSVIVCFTFVLSGFGIFTRYLSAYMSAFMLDLVTYFSFSRHFEALQRGVIDSRGLAFFLSVILAGIWATMVVLERRKHE